MKSKAAKTQKATRKINDGAAKKPAGKISSVSKKELPDNEEEDDPDEKITRSEPVSKKGEKGVSAKKKNVNPDDDNDEGDEEVVDEWEKVEEEDDWDPDFEEFDMPKSKGKKSGTRKKGDDDDDFKMDDEFKDMDLFNDRGFDDDDEEF